MGTTGETTPPRNDLGWLLQHLCDLEHVIFVTTAGGGLFFTYLHSKHGQHKFWTSPTSQHHWFRLDAEGWGLWSMLDSVLRVRFVREPDHHAPGQEVVSIRFVGVKDEPALACRFIDLYDEQSQPIPERFARWEELRAKYGGQDEVAVEHGMLAPLVRPEP